MKLDVLKQVIKELAAEFTELREVHEIYLVPRITPLPSASPLELQVCEAGAEYIDHDGSARREQFVLKVGIMQKVAFDSSNKSARALTDQTYSVFALKERVIDKLDNSFLPSGGDTLLVRPLIILKESEVEESKDGNVNIKTLVFSGGLNAVWDPTSGKWVQ